MSSAFPGIETPAARLTRLVNNLSEALHIALGVPMELAEIGEPSPSDREAIATLLTGGYPEGGGARLMVQYTTDYATGRQVYSLYTRHGGYALLWRDSVASALVLNMDIALMVIPERIDQLRKIILETADRIAGSVPVVPVGLVAYCQGPANLPTRRATLTLIHRDGFESVFTVDHSGKVADRADGSDIRYYLSGWDDQESPPLYFLCRLPHGVKTVAEARDSLMPESVWRAKEAGKRVIRQGDLFAIQSDITTEEIIAAGGKIHLLDEDESAVVHYLHPPLGFYGTAHSATKVAVLPSGMMMASGTMYHQPSLIGDRRDPDHSPMWLGDSWHFVAKNTVPVIGPASARERQSW